MTPALSMTTSTRRPESRTRCAKAATESRSASIPPEPSTGSTPATPATRTAAGRSPKRSVLAPDELIAAVLVPPAPGPQQFAKVGTRNSMVIAVCSFGLAVDPTTRTLGTGIGSAGPTTSYRMDTYSPALLRQGLTGMIGKGKRSEAVIEAIRACGAVYFGATGGCGALLSQCIKKAEVIAYPDLGPEAVRRLYVENFPVTVIIDSEGNNLYEIGRQNYLDSMRQREACGSGV